MTRLPDDWVQREFGPRIRMLSPNDPQGPTIIWSERGVYLPRLRLLWRIGRKRVATETCHTYVSDFLALASEVIEDVQTFPDDAAVHAELRSRGLEP